MQGAAAWRGWGGQAPRGGLGWMCTDLLNDVADVLIVDSPDIARPPVSCSICGLQVSVLTSPAVTTLRSGSNEGNSAGARQKCPRYSNMLSAAAARMGCCSQ